jgi:hypothetical protein
MQAAMKCGVLTGHFHGAHCIRERHLRADVFVLLHNASEHHKGEKRNRCRVLVGKPEGKRPLGRPRYKWEDKTKTDVREGVGGMDWIDLAQGWDKRRYFVNVVMNLQVP